MLFFILQRSLIGFLKAILHEFRAFKSSYIFHSGIVLNSSNDVKGTVMITSNEVTVMNGYKQNCAIRYPWLSEMSLKE
jgi:hypothetical protein